MLNSVPRCPAMMYSLVCIEIGCKLDIRSVFYPKSGSGPKGGVTGAIEIESGEIGNILIFILGCHRISIRFHLNTKYIKVKVLWKLKNRLLFVADSDSFGNLENGTIM